MSGATRFFILLATTSLPRLHLHHLSFSRLAHRSSLSLASHHHPLAPLNASHQFHAQSSDAQLTSSPLPLPSHPWPHWSDLVNNLAAAGYYHRQAIDGQDELFSAGDLPDAFVRAANACLAFALDRPDILGKLTRRDIEVVVENGFPFLFKNAEESARRMRSFLCNRDSKVLVSDSTCTVDLMRFLLSYASSPVVSSEKKIPFNNNVELVESSVRNLLSELVKLTYNGPESIKGWSAENQTLDGHGQMSKPLGISIETKREGWSAENQTLDGHGQMSKPLGISIETKRGDWICPRCTFMNFSRNVECRECQESRPKRQLTGGEWECPQCDYYNHGKNLVCLRCDCKRSGDVLHGSTNSGSSSGNGNKSYADKVDVDGRFAANEEKAQRWFSKVSQLDGTSDASNTIADKDFPEIMPLRKGVNRFVVSTRKTPLERRLANSQYHRNLDSDVISGQSAGASSTSTQIRLPGGSNYVPFVPLPADKFAKKAESPKLEENKKAMMDNHRSVHTNTSEQMGNVSEMKDPVKSGDSIQISEKPVSQSESKSDEEAATEKSQRWFKRVAELHNVEDLASAIPDEEFPAVMPMRKGENRFVINKKKDRSLTSPMYKRRMAIEQTNNNNFVPFVPLPSDYFAKKGRPQLQPQPDTTAKHTSETPSSAMQEKLSEKSDSVKQIEKQPTSTRSRNLAASMEKPGENKTDATYGAASSSSYQGKEKTNETTSSSAQSENESNIRARWSGKSLEGSAVKEADPLDMSEEGKAERWFRRVAQIKDISELSQIPDEDFPSIMPMRKGVNRFVVSKRKTPLERRLTSPQYRKNIPISTSDPTNKENQSGQQSS